jgi:geranylgeranyl pyrophosphate synthase
LGGYLGARLATDDEVWIETFTQFGKQLGILVQIGNDIDGLGKGTSSGGDLAVGKRTLPVIYALQVLPAEERARLTELLNAAPKDKSAENDARESILRAGAIVYLSLEASKHKQRAKNALSQMKLDREAANQLFRLLDHAIRIDDYL